MRTTIRTIAAMSAAILALVSCSKDNLIGNGKKNNDGVRVISLSFAQSTKTVLGENGITPKFVAGDVIKLSDGSKTEECTVEENGGVATITTTLSGTLKAIYPASAANAQCDGIVNPTDQDGTFKNANICMATIEDGAKKAEFYNKTAILRFYVDNSIGVKSITVKQAPTAGTDSITINVTPTGKDSFDETVTDGPDKRLCYVSVAGGPAASSLRFISETITQGTVSRKPTSAATLEDGGMYNAFIPYYIAVDLGKEGVQKWGYCNVGAFLPEEAGEYFMWGEVVGHKWVGGSWTNFPTENPDPSRYTGSWNAESGFAVCNIPYIKSGVTKGSPMDDGIEGASDYNKYNASNEGIELMDDAANVNWGGEWRLPSNDDFSKLMGGATNDDNKTENGILLRHGISFPAAGYGDGTNLKSDCGLYLIRTLSSSSAYKVQRLFINNEHSNIHVEDRWHGCSVRPISN